MNNKDLLLIKIIVSLAIRAVPPILIPIVAILLFSQISGNQNIEEIKSVARFMLPGVEAEMLEDYCRTLSITGNDNFSISISPDDTHNQRQDIVLAAYSSLNWLIDNYGAYQITCSFGSQSFLNDEIYWRPLGLSVNQAYTIVYFIRNSDRLTLEYKVGGELVAIELNGQRLTDKSDIQRLATEHGFEKLIVTYDETPEYLEELEEFLRGEYGNLYSLESGLR